jgi:hypothetical protein
MNGLHPMTAFSEDEKKTEHRQKQNAGVLRFAQNDDVKQTSSTARHEQASSKQMRKTDEPTVEAIDASF